MNWNEKEVLISGGTGSLGKTLTRILLERYDQPRGIRIFSRDELKQWEMKQALAPILGDAKVSYLVGDIRDRKRVELACKGVHIIIHAAALKQVPSCEDNPLEAIQTNVIGAQNILYAALENKVEKVMAISTDKAVYPINLYGATKMCAEKLFIQGNTYSGGRSPHFSCCRYGNVIGSRGSVVPLFKRQFTETGKITITDSQMTRFWITLDQVANFILQRIEDMQGGEIFIPVMPACSVLSVAKAVVPGAEIEIVGIRPGEKLHEILITKEESRRMRSVPSNQQAYYILDQNERLPCVDFEYRSNDNLITNLEQIKEIIK